MGGGAPSWTLLSSSRLPFLDGFKVLFVLGDFESLHSEALLQDKTAHVLSPVTHEHHVLGVASMVVAVFMYMLRF